MTLFSADAYLLKALEAFSHRRVVVSSDFRILAAPPPALDEEAGDVTGLFCHQVFFGQDRPCDNCGVREALDTGRPVVRQVPRDKNEKAPKFERHFIPLPEGGSAAAVAILDLDTGFFGGLRQSVGSSDAFLQNLIQSSVDGIIAADLTGRILLFNETACRMCGYTREEALTGLNIRDIYPGDGAREIMRLLRSDEYGGKGKLKSHRVNLKRKDGTVFPAALSAAIVYDCGQEIASVGFFYDLREKLRMEGELQQAQVQLMQAEKMSSIGKLSAGVAHQLNNPIGSIIIFSQLLMEEYDLPPGARKDLQRIIEDAERCQQIVSELLDFARQSVLEMRSNDINRALERTIFLLENQPLFRQIEIVRDFDPKLPQVPSDLQQLNHVFMNIILNAADAMAGQGRLTIKTRLAQARNRVLVEIADTGPGIRSEVLPHIFDPFFTTKEEGQGTGLGLSVAYGVIENHGGRLTACSAPGQGTTFMIELPLENERGKRADARRD
ncbi:MAG: ATP-binding protein [Thermodesulfobacteriota bacterium]